MTELHELILLISSLFKYEIIQSPWIFTLMKKKKQSIAPNFTEAITAPTLITLVP